MTNYFELLDKHPEINLLLNQDATNIHNIMAEYFKEHGIDIEGLPTLIYIDSKETEHATPPRGQNTIPIIVDGEQHLLGDRNFRTISSIKINPMTVANHAELVEKSMTVGSLLSEIPKSLLTMEPFSKRLIRRVGANLAIIALYTLTQSEPPSPALINQLLRSAKIS